MVRSSRRGWQQLAAIGLGVGVSSVLIVYLAYETRKRYRRTPLTAADWETFRAGDTPFESLLLKASAKGVSPEARSRVWPYILELWKPEWSEDKVAERLAVLRKEYQRLLDKCEELDSEHNECTSQSDPTTEADAKQEGRESAEFATSQRIILLDAIRTSFPAGEELPCNSREPPRRIREAIGHATYLTPPEQAAAFRLVDVLCAYAVHDPDTGYCQGMTDLALPFITVLCDDATAFWCFANFMHSARENFRQDGSGIRRRLEELAKILAAADPQLMQRLKRLDCEECFFAYRMLLVMFRRELPLPQAMTLWEVLWADRLLSSRQKAPDATTAVKQQPAEQPGMLAFVLAAAVMSQRRAILRSCQSGDDVLGLFAGQRLQLGSMLAVAQRLKRNWHGHQD